MAEPAVKVPARLYECRDTVRTLYGGGYREKIEPFMDLLSQVSQKQGLPLLSTAQGMAEDLMAAGKTPLLVLAAYVELVEPSVEVPHG